MRGIFQPLAKWCFKSVGLLSLLLPLNAYAEQITAGHLTGTGHISALVNAAMEGPTFRFGFGGSALGGVWGPADCMMTMMCVPGATIDLYARFSGKDFPGSAVYDGQVYTDVGSLNGSSWMDARWFGSLAIPSQFTGGILTAPFLFEGLFGFSGGSLSLSGGGTIYADFVPRPTGTFHLRSITYQFEDPANRSVNPEPSTWLLIATGTAWLARRRRRSMRVPRS